MKTLFFEEIAEGAIVTTNSISRFPGGHTNASGSAYKYYFRKGRAGQTEGNYQGDTNGHIPACPYHMPKNNERANDPRLFLPTKDVGDIIEADDLNMLNDRINLLLYAWNSEVNDIYGYGINIKLRNSIIKNYGSLIESEGSNFSSPPIIDPKISGTQNIDISRKVYFKQFKSTNIGEVIAGINKYNDPIYNKDDKELLSHPMGSPLEYLLPKDETNKTESISGHQVHHFGKGKLQNGILEYISDGIYAFVIGRTSSGITQWGNTIQLNGSYIYSYRDQDDDPLDPVLWYVGTKIFNAPLNPDQQNTELNEEDLTYSDTPRNKIGKYPEISASDWTNTRLTLKQLISSYNTVSVSTLDSDTLNTIGTYNTIESAGSTEVDPDSPETQFYNYQAKPGVQIKVDFYNTLIGAYRLLINSCICNTDCYCNVDCICNINCGCNY